jgi:hypothetical protein
MIIGLALAVIERTIDRRQEAREHAREEQLHEAIYEVARKSLGDLIKDFIWTYWYLLLPYLSANLDGLGFVTDPPTGFHSDDIRNTHRALQWLRARMGADWGWWRETPLLATVDALSFVTTDLLERLGFPEFPEGLRRRILEGERYQGLEPAEASTATIAEGPEPEELPDMWLPSPEAFERAIAEYPGVDLEAETWAYLKWARTEKARLEAPDVTWLKVIEQVHEWRLQTAERFQSPQQTRGRVIERLTDIAQRLAEAGDLERAFVLDGQIDTLKSGGMGIYSPNLGVFRTKDEITHIGPRALSGPRTEVGWLVDQLRADRIDVTEDGTPIKLGAPDPSEYRWGALFEAGDSPSTAWDERFVPDSWIRRTFDRAAKELPVMFGIEPKDLGG